MNASVNLSAVGTNWETEIRVRQVSLSTQRCEEIPCYINLVDRSIHGFLHQDIRVLRERSIRNWSQPNGDSDLGKVDSLVEEHFWGDFDTEDSLIDLESLHNGLLVHSVEELRVVKDVVQEFRLLLEIHLEKPFFSEGLSLLQKPVSSEMLAIQRHSTVTFAEKVQDRFLL